jgi:Uncharacterized protein conserved in bacteria
MAETVPVKVQILDREYLVACPEEEKAALLKSAAYLNQRMQEIRDKGKVVGIDRIAVMTALNLAHELLQGNQDQGQLSELRQRLQTLNDRLAAVVGT